MCQHIAEVAVTSAPCQLGAAATPLSAPLAGEQCLPTHWFNGGRKGNFCLEKHAYKYLHTNT